ncbi:MAG: glycogen debranching protein GlgX [Spirochaetota bacterium]|jgi:glycogen operon protein|nr:glycogen debranching protein GlgX [Spirochaetota bacterium]
MRRLWKNKAELKVSQGSPLWLGASVGDRGVNFAVISAGASAVSIVFFESGIHNAYFEVALDPRRNKTGDVWHALIEGLPEGFRYGYRVDGPYNPKKGYRFDRQKILIDPYALALTGGAIWGKPLQREGARDHSFTYLRRSFLPRRDFDWQGDRPLGRALSETIIYELHVRGYTIHAGSGVKHPGTFRGLIEKIPYLQSLGVNAVELMPVNEFDEEAGWRANPLTGERLVNFWGYTPYAFFAPKASYAASALSGGQVDEFREMVREFHKAGIEIILDVVFNHTGEGDAKGPVFSFRGLDDGAYYMLDENGGYRNYSGCGNTMNCNRHQVRQLIMDCLRYWVAEMHVDGFRFDLASVLGRDSNGEVLPDPPVLDEIAHDPVLASTKIIAEAWDAAGLYQVGSFPAWGRWAEWNGRYRDDVRRFLLGELGSTAAFATRVTGSSDLYECSGRAPQHSINFITCHDGFTLRDLATYNTKHNEANGENNRDGENYNISYNYGVEGESNIPSIRRLRRRYAKNAMLIMMLSQGTPMLLAGDEFLRTQGGNNNPYCQDNAVSWVDWSFVNKEEEHLDFCRNVILLRKEFASLKRENFLSGTPDAGSKLPDISWHGIFEGEPDFEKGEPRLAFLLAGVGREPALYAAYNMATRPAVFHLPESPDGVWFRKINTAAQSGRDFFAAGQEKREIGSTIRLRPRSIIVLVSKPMA